MTTTGDILRSAAAHVRRGWCQHRAFDVASVRVCAYGAVAVASVSSVHHYNTAARYLGRAIGLNKDPILGTFGMVRRIFQWNDAHGQTQDNVAATLELAAILADQDQASGPSVEADDCQKHVERI